MRQRNSVQEKAVGIREVNAHGVIVELDYLLDVLVLAGLRGVDIRVPAKVEGKERVVRRKVGPVVERHPLPQVKGVRLEIVADVPVPGKRWHVRTVRRQADQRFKGVLHHIKVDPDRPLQRVQVSTVIRRVRENRHSQSAPVF